MNDRLLNLDPMPDGSPLAVCINDCEIDCGQEKSELAPICFNLGCAFAEMRWGKRPEETRAVSTASRPFASMGRW